MILKHPNLDIIELQETAFVESTLLMLQRLNYLFNQDSISVNMLIQSIKERACLGDTESIRILGYYYSPYLNIGETNLELSSYWFSHAADKGCHIAIISHIILCNDLEDFHKINIEGLQISYLNGHLDAGYILARILLKYHALYYNRDDAIKLIKRLHEQCYELATIELAKLYFEGKIVPSGPELAIRLLTLKQYRKSAVIQLYLSHIYENGIYVSKNMQKAKMYVEFARKCNNAYALLEVTRFYQRNHEYYQMSENYLFDLLKESANLGCREAYLYLSEYYIEGKIVAKDFSLANNYRILGRDHYLQRNECIIKMFLS